MLMSQTFLGTFNNSAKWRTVRFDGACQPDVAVDLLTYSFIWSGELIFLLQMNMTSEEDSGQFHTITTLEYVSKHESTET